MKKQTKKNKLAEKIKEPKRDRDLPVTKRLLDLRIQEVKGDITSLRLEMKAQLSTLDTKITKMIVMMEDQNDRNRATLDANTMVYEKIVENDARVEKLEERVFGSKQR